MLRATGPDVSGEMCSPYSQYKEDPLWLQRETDAESLTRLAACSVQAHRVGGGNLHRQSLRDSFVVGSCLFCSEEDKRSREGGKMENESKRKMKERFGLRRDIFKEFLAEFLGIFVLIVSTSLCTCHQA